MADIFTKNDAQKVVEFRVIWFWGDSNIRAVYKDLVWLLQKNTLVNMSSLRSKLEHSFMNDCLVGGQKLHKGRNYMEVRCFENFSIPAKIEFTFLTECINERIREKITKLSPADTPDVIVMNSCLWDITRWGPESVPRYKKNIRELLQLFKDHLPSKTLVLWTTTPPISNHPHGGFLINQVNFMKNSLRYDVMEANWFVSQQFVKYGFDVLDVHYHLLHQIHRRRPDGIHWNPDAVRHITNLILTHVAISFEMSLPGNFKTPALEEFVFNKGDKTEKNKSVDLNNNQVANISNSKSDWHEKDDSISILNITDSSINNESILNNNNCSIISSTSKMKKKRKNHNKSRLRKQQKHRRNQRSKVLLNFGYCTNVNSFPIPNSRDRNRSQERRL